MASTTSKRLKRVWELYDAAEGSDRFHIHIDDLAAALEGGDKWAQLKAIWDQVPLPPEEYRAEYEAAFLTEFHGGEEMPDHLELIPPAYEAWYETEMDRLAELEHNRHV